MEERVRQEPIDDMSWMVSPATHLTNDGMRRPGNEICSHDGATNVGR